MRVLKGPLYLKAWNPIAVNLPNNSQCVTSFRISVWTDSHDITCCYSLCNMIRDWYKCTELQCHRTTTSHSPANNLSQDKSWERNVSLYTWTLKRTTLLIKAARWLSQLNSYIHCGSNRSSYDQMIRCNIQFPPFCKSRNFLINFSTTAF